MAQSRRFQPFNKKDLETLRIAEKAIQDLLPELDKAAACGLECEAFRDVAAELLRRAALLRETFMTPAPTK